MVAVASTVEERASSARREEINYASGDAGA